MGFRDLEAFNQALLAKQAWRILQVPNSLCARVLKARYFKDESILSASCPASGSFTFRSILHGRDLLREGLIWRIGSGTNINIHHDAWIPRNGSTKPLGQVYIQGITKVSHLMNPDGRSWNEELVDQMFTVADAIDVKQIAIGGPAMDDLLAWNFTRDGVFTVRSAYHFRMSLNRARSGQPEPSSSAAMHKGYLSLWDTNAPGKVKIHMWRMIHNGLAVGAELHRRRIKPGVFCVVCAREETMMHRFWGCQHSIMFWDKLRKQVRLSLDAPPSHLHSQRGLASWLLDWFARASGDEKEFMLQAA